MKVVSITTDGASNMAKGIRDFFGKECHLKCLAHTIDLVANNASSQDAVKDTVKEVKDITRYFKKSAKAASSLRAKQNDKQVALRVKQSCQTRWNSLFYQFERFLVLKDLIVQTLEELYSPHSISESS